MGVRDTVFYDPHTFRKHFRLIGRAYKEQATTLIGIYRLYVGSPQTQTYTKNDRLQMILRLADAALSAAGKAKKDKTPEATDAFLRLREELLSQLVFPPPREDSLDDHQKMLLSPHAALELAFKRDERTASAASKVKSAFKAPLPSGPVKNVNVWILESPSVRRKDQLIINQEVDNSTTISEIIWRFSRYPEESGMRITARQNPHFYLQLSPDATSYGDNFHKDPLQDEFGRGLAKGDTIYVIVDKSCRLFLDAAKPHSPRIFGNLWKPYRSFILKDAGGVLESEDIVFGKIGKMQDYWYRHSITDSSRRSVYSNDDSEIVKKPVGNWRALLEAALISENVDFMIRDQSRPEPPADSGWKRLPSPEPGAGVQLENPEDQITPRQSYAQLPQLEDLNPNSSFYGIGDRTPFGNSTESFQTAVNASHISLPLQAAASERPQSFDSEVAEVPTADDLPSAQPDDLLPQLFYPVHYAISNFSTSSIGSSLIFIPNGSLESLANISDTPSSSAPPSPASLTIPSHLPGQHQELPSEPPVREWETPGKWFQKYDYDTES